MAEVAAAPGDVSRSRPGLLDLPPEILLKILKLLWEDNVLEFVRSGAPLACRRLRQLSQDCFSWEEVRAKFGDGERFKEWCKEKDKLRDYRESKERYATLVLCIFFFHIFCVFFTGSSSGWTGSRRRWSFWAATSALRPAPYTSA